MNKNINKSCRYCITAFAAVTDRKLSLQGSVICWKWGVSGMLVTWDRAFSNSSVFRGLLVSLHSSGGSWGAHPGTEEPPDKPSTSLVSWHQTLSQLWKPVGQLDSPWSSGDERSGMAWAEHGRQNISPCQKFGCGRNWVSLSHHLMMVMGTTSYSFCAWDQALKGEFWVWAEPWARQALLPLGKAVPVLGMSNLGPEGKHSQRDWTLQPVGLGRGVFPHKISSSLSVKAKSCLLWPALPREKTLDLSFPHSPRNKNSSFLFSGMEKEAYT